MFAKTLVLTLVLAGASLSFLGNPSAAPVRQDGPEVGRSGRAPDYSRALAGRARLDQDQRRRGGLQPAYYVRPERHDPTDTNGN